MRERREEDARMLAALVRVKVYNGEETLTLLDMASELADKMREYGLEDIPEVAKQVTEYAVHILEVRF